MIYKLHYESPLGDILIIARECELTGLYINPKSDGFDFKGEEISEEKIPMLKKTAEWLDRYFNGEKPDISELELNPDGSAFQKVVWGLLCDIPYGKTETYGDIAKKAAEIMGKEKMSAQAVGGAVGSNPIAIIIPCHRVIGANGNLTGYSGGISIKVKFLKHECALMPCFYIPKKSVSDTSCGTMRQKNRS